MSRETSRNYPIPREASLGFWAFHLKSGRNIQPFYNLGLIQTSSCGTQIDESLIKLHSANPHNAFYIRYNIEKVQYLVMNYGVQLQDILNWASIPGEIGKSSVGKLFENRDNFTALENMLRNGHQFSACIGQEVTMRRFSEDLANRDSRHIIATTETDTPNPIKTFSDMVRKGNNVKPSGFTHE